MAKQVLGRNLGALLDSGAKEPGKSESAAIGTAPLGSGVRSLMRGNQPNVSSPPPAAPVPKSIVPAWYLFAGDILLTALALVIVFKSPRPLSWPREMFCAAAVVLGGCLAVGAVFLADTPDAK